jgi:hypothetical protein
MAEKKVLIVDGNGTSWSYICHDPERGGRTEAGFFRPLTFRDSTRRLKW